MPSLKQITHVLCTGKMEAEQSIEVSINLLNVLESKENSINIINIIIF